MTEIEKAIEIIDAILLTVETNDVAFVQESHLDGLRTAQSALREKQTARQNAPLTLEELRGMDGQPIWYKNKKGAEWCIIRVINGQFFAQSGGSNNCAVNCDTYGKTWLAYRRPPEQ